MSSDQSSSSGLFGALKKGASLFVQFEEPETAQPATPYKTAASPARSTTGYSAPAYDPDMLAALSKAIMSRKTPYTALLEASQKLEKVIPHDETMRVKAAFATLGDRSPNDVIQAIDVHLADLEGERLRFKQATGRNLNDRAGSIRTSAAAKEVQLSNNTVRIQQLRDDAAKLEEQNSQLTGDIHTLNAQADSAEAEIKTVETRFNATVDYLKNDLTGKKTGLGSLLS